MTGIPSPSLNTRPCEKPADRILRLYLFWIIRFTALKANCPRQRIVIRSFSESISLARYVAQLDVSSIVGLLSGGAHLTAAVTYAPLSVSPSSVLRDVGW